MKTVSMKLIAVIFGAGAFVLGAGIFPCSVAHAQADGWGKWKKIHRMAGPSESGVVATATSTAVPATFPENKPLLGSADRVRAPPAVIKIIVGLAIRLIL